MTVEKGSIWNKNKNNLKRSLEHQVKRIIYILFLPTTFCFSRILYSQTRSMYRPPQITPHRTFRPVSSPLRRRSAQHNHSRKKNERGKKQISTAPDILLFWNQPDAWVKSSMRRRDSSGQVRIVCMAAVSFRVCVCDTHTQRVRDGSKGVSLGEQTQL